VWREWFAHGVTEISVIQRSGHLLVEIEKEQEKSWDELLSKLMPSDPTKGWEEVGDRLPVLAEDPGTIRRYIRELEEEDANRVKESW